MSVRKGNDVIAGGTVITIDSSLNANSINPVQNSAITTAINNNALTPGNGIQITPQYGKRVIRVSNLDCGTM